MRKLQLIAVNLVTLLAAQTWSAPAPIITPPAAQTVYVLMNGNDGTGQRGVRDQPFLSISNALAAALPGDTVYVGPGIFSGIVPTKQGVSFYLERGCILTNNGVALIQHSNDVVIRGEGVLSTKGGLVFIPKGLHGTNTADVVCDSIISDCDIFDTLMTNVTIKARLISTIAYIADHSGPGSSVMVRDCNVYATAAIGCTNFTYVNCNVTNVDASGLVLNTIITQYGGTFQLDHNETGPWDPSATLNLYGVTVDNASSLPEPSRLNGFYSLSKDLSTVKISASVSGVDGSGPDQQGAALTLQAGRSTGTGRGGAVILQTTPSGSTGSTPNPLSTRTYISARDVTLTESTATPVVSVTVAPGKTLGMRLMATTRANNASDFQARTDSFVVSAVNKAGTVKTAISAPDTTAAVSTGALKTTWTAVANQDRVEIRNNARSSLNQTTLVTEWRVEIDSNDAPVITPQ